MSRRKLVAIIAIAIIGPVMAYLGVTAIAGVMQVADSPNSLEQSKEPTTIVETRGQPTAPATQWPRPTGDPDIYDYEYQWLGHQVGAKLNVTQIKAEHGLDVVNNGDDLGHYTIMLRQMRDKEAADFQATSVNITMSRYNMPRDDAERWEIERFGYDGRFYFRDATTGEECILYSVETERGAHWTSYETRKACESETAKIRLVMLGNGTISKVVFAKEYEENGYLEVAKLIKRGYEIEDIHDVAVERWDKQVVTGSEVILALPARQES